MPATPIPAHVLKNGPWSISKAGVIAKCSLQYDYKYGGQKQPELTPSSTDSRLGVAVHMALELGLDGVKIKDAFTMAADKHQLTTNEVETLQSHYEQVGAFIKKMGAFQVRHGVRPQNVLREKKIGISTEFKNIPFFDNTGLFRGVLDLAMLTGLGDAVVIDHKSGKQKDLKDYADQCKAYCILILAMFPELKGVQTAINFTQTDQLLWNTRVTASTIRDEYHPWLIQYLTDSCTKLLGPVEPTQGWYCDWCGYKPLCPKFANQ